jgi:predicted nucleotide-binding protein (sugar kinase/HSP70/actin superfamily)
LAFTFPYFGSLTYVFEILLREIGRKDIMLPKKPNRRTAELGSRYSPEFICTPFKLTLGTFIEMLEEGAEELGTGGCNSWCRFGYYWPVQKLILEDLGYDFRFISLDYLKPFTLLKTLKDEVGCNCNLQCTIRAFRIAWIKNRLTDLVDELLYKYRVVETEKGLSEKIAEKAFRMVVETKGLTKIKKLRKHLPEFFEKNIDVQKIEDQIKIGICGEMYVVFEPSLNLDIHKKLNDLGAIVKNTVSLRSYLDIGLKLNPFVKSPYKTAIKAAKPYLENKCGGETLENIGDIVLCKEHGYDGMVHLYPFTCMPEIITRSFIPQISKKHDVPVLSLVLDEHTGETGFKTRIEAFIDMLIRRKMK